MFKCDICGQIAPSRTKCTEVVLKSREKEYPYREGVNRMATWKKERQDRYDSTNDSGGTGWEFERTIKACIHCAKK